VEGDPLARIHEREREAARDGQPFDLETELRALDDMGYVFPLPIVSRVLGFADLVRSVGWKAASRLSCEVFRGWEVDFLAAALPIISSYRRSEDLLAEARVFGLTRRA